MLIFRTVKTEGSDEYPYTCQLMTRRNHVARIRQGQPFRYVYSDGQTAEEAELYASHFAESLGLQYRIIRDTSAEEHFEGVHHAEPT